MRRTTGLILIAVGVLLLVLGPALRFYAYPRLAIVPNDQTQSVSVGDDVRILDIALVAEGADHPVRPMDVVSTRRVIPDVEAGDDEVAVWETGVNNVSSEDGETRSAYQERVAFDRHTGEAVSDPEGETYGQYYLASPDDDDREPVEHTGWYFKLPFATEQTDYEFWDSTLQETRPAVFEGEDTVEGLAVYRFVQRIDPTVLPDGERDLPGALFGSDENTVTAERYYANTRTLWVEPNTGVIIRGQEEQNAYFQYEGEQLTITQGTIGYSDETVAANIDSYEGTASLLNLIRNVLPIVLPIVGLVLIVVGVLLTRDRQRPRRARSGDVPPSDGDGDTDDGSLLDRFGEPHDEVAAGARAARRRSG